MEHIEKNIYKFVKLYEIVLEDNNFELLTPRYLKNFKTLVYLAGFICNHFHIEKIKIYDEDLLNYKEEIEKFHYDSIENYNKIVYDDDIQNIISNL
jgi:hypothetical protein